MRIVGFWDEFLFSKLGHVIRLDNLIFPDCGVATQAPWFVNLTPPLAAALCAAQSEVGGSVPVAGQERGSCAMRGGRSQSVL